ncbi:MAG: hypothetical protein VXY73_07250 [Pseudomonadota bacterium]|nr:hypothetical protein [Pseudomonadota bacterium]
MPEISEIGAAIAEAYEGVADVERFRPGDRVRLLALEAALSNLNDRASLARVSASGDDSEAASAARQLADGSWYYPKLFATLDGAGDNTVAGDTIELQATQWTETGVTLRGGRVYSMPDVNLVNCELTFSGSTETGPLVIRGRPTIRRTDSALVSLLVEDAEYEFELMDIDDQNLASTLPIVSVQRSHGQCMFRDVITAYRCALDIDAQWDDVAVGKFADWRGRSMKSTYGVVNVGSISNLLARVERGTKARFWLDEAHSENNILFGIGALSDPPSAIETRLEIHSGKLTGAKEAFVYYGRAGTNDSYHVEIGSSAAVLTDSAALTHRLNTPGEMTIAARGVALVSALPHGEVEGPTYGQFIVSGVA